MPLIVRISPPCIVNMLNKSITKSTLHRMLVRVSVAISNVLNKTYKSWETCNRMVVACVPFGAVLWSSVSPTQIQYIIDMDEQLVTERFKLWIKETSSAAYFQQQTCSVYLVLWMQQERTLCSIQHRTPVQMANIILKPRLSIYTHTIHSSLTATDNCASTVKPLHFAGLTLQDNVIVQKFIFVPSVSVILTSYVNTMTVTSTIIIRILQSMYGWMEQCQCNCFVYFVENGEVKGTWTLTALQYLTSELSHGNSQPSQICTSLFSSLHSRSTSSWLVWPLTSTCLSQPPQQLVSPTDCCRLTNARSCRLKTIT